jgi:hypothetical protein
VQKEHIGIFSERFAGDKYLSQAEDTEFGTFSITFGIFKANDVDFRESRKKIANNTLYYYISEKMVILWGNCEA